MDSKNIKNLLERYWEGHTTLREEQQLRQYFTSGQVPEELRREAALFRYFEQQRQVKPASGFEKQAFGRLEKTGNTRELPLPAARPRSAWWRLAAVLLLVTGVAWLLSRQTVDLNQPVPVVQQDTYQTPEEAFEETKKALMMVSWSLNNGRVQVHKIKMINEAETKIKKQLKK